MTRFLPVAALATTLVLWASAFVGIRHLGETFSPGALSLGRLVVGALALGVTLMIARSWRRPNRRELVSMAAIGVLWFGIYNIALNAGERLVDAGTAATIIQVSPVLIALLSVPLLGERLSLPLVAGMAIAFAGVALIGLSHSGSQGGDVLGVLLCLLAAITYAVSLILQKPLLDRLSALQVTWVACTVGALSTLPFAGDLVAQAAEASTGDLGWLVYLGVFPTAVAFTTYAYALRHVPASRLGVSTYLVPPLTALMSWALLAEVPPAITWVGGALCLLGVALTRARVRRRPRPDAPVAAVR
ncbi:DMT family transporter [Alteromonas gracilis]